MTFHPVFNEFLSTFTLRRVRFLIVGGHALAVHGRPRYTDDLDVWVDATPANARRVVAALKDFGYESYALHAKEFATQERMTHLGTPPMRIDIMTSITGVGFREAWAHRVPVEIAGLKLNFLGRDELIANKAASGRPKDIADLALLAEVESAAASRSERTSRRVNAVATKRKVASKRKRAPRRAG